MTISDEAVEAAAGRLFNGWENSPAEWKESFRRQARAALEAAAPHIAASIELLVLDPSKSTTPHCIEEYNAGLKNAVLAVRGAVGDMDK